MEDELDEIASKKKAWPDVIKDFYTPFEKTLENAKEVIERVKMPDEVTTEVCEKCGKPMIVKVGRFGKFLACSGYPECKNTKPYRIKTGVLCPECGGDLQKRMNKKGKAFYGCSNYPNCKFAVNAPPIAEKCPECGGLLTLAGENKVRCIKCRYRGPAPEAKTPVGAAQG
jgi:DNA topoisomerase-1